jgi:hypothetical protein
MTNRLSKRSLKWLSLLFSIFIFTIIGKNTNAQNYPTKPVRYVVAFSAGDSPDIVARIVTDKLSHLWDQQIIVENRTGAGGTIAGNFVAKSVADGYILFHCNIASNSIAPGLYNKLPYDGLNDFSPVSRIGSTPNAFNVHPSIPVHNIKELVARAIKNPGTLSYGHSGLGASPHLSMELFKSVAHIDIAHVAYKGATPALMDLLGGQIPIMVSNLPALLPYSKSGKIRILAVTGLRRAAVLSEVPTVSESGYPGFDVNSWYGMCGPAGTPVPILEKLHTDLLKVLQMPEVNQRLNDMVVEPTPQSREEFTNFIKSEITRWTKVIKDANITKQ